MFPVYDALYKNKKFDTILVHSGQHDEMAIQALETFGIIPNYTCNVLDDDKVRLGDLVSRLIQQFTIAFYELKPNLVLVHGDTTTAFSATVAAFLQNIKIGHVEAGLRTSRFEYPFPEEGYRRIISRIATYHFAPTPKSASNLRAENINANIHVVGNTVVDSLKKILPLTDSVSLRRLRAWTENYALVLVTAHRRETYGEPLLNLCKTVKDIVLFNPYVKIIWPVHFNPNVREVVLKNINNPKILLEPPLNYEEFTKLLDIADLVITDSGGVMEEAAVLGKPTLVLRTETERPEVLELDNVRLVGYDFEQLLTLSNQWIKTPPKMETSSVFGDGTAGVEIMEIIEGEII